MNLGRLGVYWNGAWDPGKSGSTPSNELAKMGYATFWTSGRLEPGVSPVFKRLLEDAPSTQVASGVISIWANPPDELAARISQIESEFPGRFVLGLGASHASMIKGYGRPYSTMVEYLDALDVRGGAVDKQRRMLAALGPRMLALARDRSEGAHPYLVPPEHTEFARSILGPHSILAPEVSVILEEDPDRARAGARHFLSHYLPLPNYTNNLRRFGFGFEDFNLGGSDRLVDALVCWGDPARIKSRVDEHFDAGADHVCLQVISEAPDSFPTTQYEELASTLSAAQPVSDNKSV
jgi:probable F420-dependent oxidoreductase